MKSSMYISIFLCFLFLIMFFCNGCSQAEAPKKVKDLDFTVCDESRLPVELVDIINEKKESPFRLTYTTGSYMYIVVGYGAQNRDCLSVAVKDLYLGENEIYVDTSLISDSQERKEGVVTCPYLALKCEKYDLPVIYLMDQK